MRASRESGPGGPPSLSLDANSMTGTERTCHLGSGALLLRRGLDGERRPGSGFSHFGGGGVVQVKLDSTNRPGKCGDWRSSAGRLRLSRRNAARWFVHPARTDDTGVQRIGKDGCEKTRGGVPPVWLLTKCHVPVVPAGHADPICEGLRSAVKSRADRGRNRQGDSCHQSLELSQVGFFHVPFLPASPRRIACVLRSETFLRQRALL